ncbi:polysaccharide biosynthesis tyrosine autokinase, partial [Sulfurovum sp. bin170]|uniref:GumC family protein n=1 Tax=Sulfurovum sp. bin170 TaxID=2695268 RepID=UPI0013E0AC43
MKSYKSDIEDDFNIKEIFKILKEYRWLIFTTVILSVSFASTKVYLSKHLYSAFSVVKVKTKSENSQNLILSDKGTMAVVNIQEDIALLRTFYMNNKALNLKRVDFKVLYYTRNGYKSKELYRDIPIKITDIETIDERYIGAKLRVTQKEDGYTIEFVHSLKNEIMNKLFKKSLLKIDAKEPFKYHEKIKTNFFSLKIHKLSNFDKPIDIIIYGDNRYVYDNIIRNNLEVVQIDDKIPHIQISYQDKVPSRAVSYIESLTDSFINESLAENRKQNNQILDFIDKELKKIKKLLKTSEKELENYRISNKIVYSSVQASTFIRELSSVDITLSENELKIKVVNNLLKLIENNYSFDAMTPSLVELQDSSALKLIDMLQEAQLTREELLADFTVKHPKIKKVDSKISTIRAKIILNIENLQKHILEKNKNLKKIKKSYETKIETLPTKERKMINIKRDYEVSSKMYNFLLEKRTENEILKVSNLSKYKIIDKAYSDFSPVGNKSKAILISSIFIGFLLGVLLIALHRIFSDKILTVKSIESYTEIPIYGVAPFLKSSEHLYIQKPSVVDSYSAIRTNIQLSKKQSKVILLSSTMDDEGKDMATINLARSFARVDCKTLLIDLDIRFNSINRVLNVESHAGISRYLAGEMHSIYDIKYPTKYKNLTIIPAGDSSSSNISRLILSKGLPPLIEELKESYDYIIINTPPFGIFTDSKYIMRLSDINLTLFREGY